MEEQKIDWVYAPIDLRGEVQHSQDALPKGWFTVEPVNAVVLQIRPMTTAGV